MGWGGLKLSPECDQYQPSTTNYQPLTTKYWLGWNKTFTCMAAVASPQFSPQSVICLVMGIFIPRNLKQANLWFCLSQNWSWVAVCAKQASSNLFHPRNVKQQWHLFSLRFSNICVYFLWLDISGLKSNQLDQCLMTKGTNICLFVVSYTNSCKVEQPSTWRNGT